MAVLLDTNNLDPSSLVHGSYSWDKSSHTVQSFIINPQRAHARRVIVVSCVCPSFCLSCP